MPFIVIVINRGIIKCLSIIMSTISINCFRVIFCIQCKTVGNNVNTFDAIDSHSTR